ncbi:MAG: hypothetical protein QNK20_01985 [Aureibaculum sp.]|nr:hypothetical protein [Aureibaculum sp.]
MLLTLLQIEGKIREIATIIHTPEEFIPTFGFSNETGLPHIEINDGHYTLIVCENGVELSRELFDDPDELLLKVLHDISFSMACDLVFEDTSDKNFRERFLDAQKNIISKIYLYHSDTVKRKQEIVITENNSALSESRKNILVKSNIKKKSLPTKGSRAAPIK